MKLHNFYGYGQLFCFSGLEGATSRDYDFVGMMMDEPISIRFHFDNAVTLKIPMENPIFKAVTGDMLDGENFLIQFIDCNTICGRTPVQPLVLTEEEAKRDTQGDVLRLETEEGVFYLTTKKEGGMYAFSFSFNQVAPIVSETELQALRAKRYAYFDKIPACKEEKYEQLYSKCISIQKENVYAPEGVIPCRWSTPDRVPHRFMWLWDSAIHAMAFAEYDVEMAKDCIRAVLTQQREDGFIAHMMGVHGRISEITQPHILGWGVWSIYQKDKDKEFLRECVPALKKFLLWTVENRDKNGNGLLEWLTEPDYFECKCGESGLDNSPRFDFDVEMDAVDFSTYLCNDARYLSWIYQELGEEEEAAYFMNMYESVKAKINELLWNEEDGLYHDRLFDGKHTHVASPSCFFPMMAEICSQEQADKMVKVLLDEKRFWTALPVPTMPKDSPFYDIDMWRGCSWLNLNYFIILGLRKYGYTDIAEELRQRSLNAVFEWYEKTGNVFEFYDADNKINPLHLKRKGEQPAKPDYRVHVHSITDYNWSSCFTMMMIQQLWK